MEYKLDDMCDWERKKAIYLLSIADELGMDLSGYGQLAVNQNSGYTYLWLEDYNFTLYLPINCELNKEDVQAMWTSPEDGEEREISINGYSLEELEKWANNQDKDIENEEQ